MVTKKPNEFRIKISEIGTNKFFGGYDIIKNKSALQLAVNVNRIMAKDFTGEKHQGEFIYNLALFLLTNVQKVDMDRFVKDYEKVKTMKPSELWIIED